MNRVWSGLLLTLGSTLAACGPAAVGPSAVPPPAARLPAERERERAESATEVAPVSPASGIAGVRTLWRQSGGSPRVIGVDASSKELFLELGRIEAEPSHDWTRSVIDTINCESGARTNTELSEDLVRYGELLRRMGLTTYFDHAGRTPDGRHLFYRGAANDGSGEEAFFVTDAEGKHRRRFDSGLRVSYNLALSPDGKWGAFSGYLAGIYHAYVRRVDATAPPVRLDIFYPNKLEFSRDDGALYALNTGRDQKHDCVHRVHPSTPWKVRAVFCSPLIGEDSTFTLSPDGKTALLSGSLRKRTSNNALWIRLSDGALLADLPMSATYGFVTNAGVMIAPAVDGLAIVDLASKKQRLVPLGPVSEVWRNSWLDDHTLVVMLIHPQPDAPAEFEFVAVDVSPPSSKP